jgi:hypothetical protein
MVRASWVSISRPACRMIVIADTGPINYLILIGEIELLPEPTTA